MNSENSKNSNPYRLVVVLTCKKILKNPEKMFCIIKPIISTICGKIEKRHINKKNYIFNNLISQLQHGVKNSIFLMDQILCQIFNIASSILLK